MSFSQSLRKLANKVFGKTASNDNLNLAFSVTDEQKTRALNPPTDNSVVEEMHGVKVSDPFRPLEDLDAPATAAWVQRQQKQFADYITGQDESFKNAKDFITDARNYDSSSLPSRYGSTYFRTFHAAGAAQSIVEIGASAEGPWETLLDPNHLSTDGTVALSGWTPSSDGKRVAYLVSEAGSDAQTMHILDVETKKDLKDIIENCRFAGILWDKGSHDSFQYTYPAHDGSRRLLAKHHHIGDDVANDKLVFDAKVDDSFGRRNTLPCTTSKRARNILRTSLKRAIMMTASCRGIPSSWWRRFRRNPIPTT